MNLEKTISKRREEIKKKISELKKEIRQIKYSKSVELSPEDKEIYDLLKDDGKPSLMRKYASEKDYLISTKKTSINFLNGNLLELKCEEKGHDEKVISVSNHGVYVQCNRCKHPYKRGMNAKESQDWYKMMHTRFR